MKCWFLPILLVACASISAETLSVHAPLGLAENPQGNDLVFGHLYALSNDPNTKMSDWVAYEVNPINYGVSLGRNWASD